MEISCPNCRKIYQIKDGFAGRSAQCTVCKARIDIPLLVDPLPKAEPNPFDFLNSPPKPVQSPPAASPLRPGDSPFAPGKPKHPAKIIMLIATAIWCCALGGSVFMSIVGALNEPSALILFRTAQYGRFIFVVLGSSLCFGFLITLPYILAMVLLAVWYFYNKD